MRLGAQELVALRWKHPVKTSYDLGYDLGLFRVYPMSGNLHSYGKHGRFNGIIGISREIFHGVPDWIFLRRDFIP